VVAPPYVGHPPDTHNISTIRKKQGKLQIKMGRKEFFEFENVDKSNYLKIESQELK